LTNILPINGVAENSHVGTMVGIWGRTS